MTTAFNIALSSARQMQMIGEHVTCLQQVDKAKKKKKRQKTDLCKSKAETDILSILISTVYLNAKILHVRFLC
jgi:hypothetical protein